MKFTLAISFVVLFTAFLVGFACGVAGIEIDPVSRTIGVIQSALAVLFTAALIAAKKSSSTNSQKLRDR